MKIKDYEYYPETGLALPSDLLEAKNLKFRENFKLNFLEKLHKSGLDEAAFYDISKEGLIKEIANVSSLILETTENCNLACGYCLYNQNYDDRRKTTKKNMSSDRAIESIDFFFDWITKSYEYRTSPMFFQIAFYGGEPTLKFDLIRESVKYINEEVSKRSILQKCKAQTACSIVTNGFDIEDKIDFFVKNNFFITFSLDGPEHIHDKNRGKGSFKQIYSILKYLYNNHRKFHDSNITINTVFYPGTNLLEIVDFFNQEMFLRCRMNFLEINIIGLLNSEMENSDDEYIGVLKNLKRKREAGEQLTNIEGKVLGRLFPIQLNYLINFPGKIPGAWCTPGTVAFFINKDGNIYNCEKVSDSFPIGNIKTGLDFDYMKKLNKDWFFSSDECRDCLAQSSCIACLGNCGINKKLDKEKTYCKFFKNIFKNKLERYLEYLEVP